jgi:light-harvesting complex I chlorophyll a/b binding protein 1
MPSLRTAVLAGLLAESSGAFTGGAPKKVVKKRPVKKAAPKAPVRSAGFSPAGDVGVTPPLGLFDPLGFLQRGPAAYRRSQEMEIKHGRLAMAGTLGVIVTEAGLRLPGTPSPSTIGSYADIPGDLAGAYFGTPLLGWIQIMCLIGALDIAVFRQDPANAPGDVVQDLGIEWVRYDDPAVKRFKLNAERNNGRAAMFGMIGMISHSALGYNALFPIVQ